MRTAAQVLVLLALIALALDFLQKDPVRGFELRAIGDVWRDTHYASWRDYIDAPRSGLSRNLLDPLLRQPSALLFLGLGGAAFVISQLGRLSRRHDDD